MHVALQLVSGVFGQYQELVAEFQIYVFDKAHADADAQVGVCRFRFAVALVFFCVPVVGKIAPKLAPAFRDGGGGFESRVDGRAADGQHEGKEADGQQAGEE